MNLRDGKRRNIQQQLDFTSGGPGEARRPGGEETEASLATREIESPASTNWLMEELSLLGRGMLAQLTRTAVYGPVRTVVWEGWGCKASPYPDHLRAPKLDLLSQVSGSQGF